MSQPALFFTFTCIENYRWLHYEFIQSKKYQGYYEHAGYGWAVVCETGETIFVSNILIPIFKELSC